MCAVIANRFVRRATGADAAIGMPARSALMRIVDRKRSTSVSMSGVSGASESCEFSVSDDSRSRRNSTRTSRKPCHLLVHVQQPSSGQ